MLVLSRKQLEALRIGDTVEVTVLEIRGGRVRLGICAPRDVRVMRRELQQGSRLAFPGGVSPAAIGASAGPGDEAATRREHGLQHTAPDAV